MWFTVKICEGCLSSSNRTDDEFSVNVYSQLQCVHMLNAYMDVPGVFTPSGKMTNVPFSSIPIECKDPKANQPIY